MWLISNHPTYDDSLQIYAQLDQFPLRLWNQASAAWNLQSAKHQTEAQVFFNSAVFHAQRNFTVAYAHFQTACDLDRMNSFYSYTFCTELFRQFSSVAAGEDKQRFASDILDQGDRALKARLDHHQFEWECRMYLSQAALALNKPDLAETYTEHAPQGEQSQEFCQAVAGLADLLRGNTAGAKKRLVLTESGTRIGFLSLHLAEQLIGVGEQTFVSEFLSGYLKAEITSSEVSDWLDDVKCGLIP